MNPIELSFEFFPPKTQEGLEKLRATRTQLLPLKPKFVSVTFGAGGSTQQGTLDTVLDLSKDGLEAAPHLSCIGSSKDSLRAILNEYRSHGIRHIAAQRDDQRSAETADVNRRHDVGDDQQRERVDQPGQQYGHEQLLIACGRVVRVELEGHA